MVGVDLSTFYRETPTGISIWSLRAALAPAPSAYPYILNCCRAPDKYQFCRFASTGVCCLQPMILNDQKVTKKEMEIDDCLCNLDQN